MGQAVHKSQLSSQHLGNSCCLRGPVVLSSRPHGAALGPGRVPLLFITPGGVFVFLDGLNLRELAQPHTWEVLTRQVGSQVLARTGLS